MNKAKGHWEAQIVDLGSLDFAKVGAKMTDLEGNKVDVLGAIDKGLYYIYFGATKFLPNLKYLFDKSPRGE
jgi:pre-mRNA-splicing factor ISY1